MRAATRTGASFASATCAIGRFGFCHEWRPVLFSSSIFCRTFRREQKVNLSVGSPLSGLAGAELHRISFHEQNVSKSARPPRRSFAKCRGPSRRTTGYYWRLTFNYCFLRIGGRFCRSGQEAGSTARHGLSLYGPRCFVQYHDHHFVHFPRESFHLLRWCVICIADGTVFVAWPRSRPAADCLVWFDHCHGSDSGRASATWKKLRQRTKDSFLPEVCPPVSGLYEVRKNCRLPAPSTLIAVQNVCV